jgi:Skp family chaperone for outer membrane proteins
MTKSTIRAALVAGAMMLAAAAAAQPVKIGTIDMIRLEKESAITIRATEILKQEFEPRRVQVENQLKQAIAARDRFTKERAGLSPESARNRENEVAETLRKAEQARARFLEELEVRKREMRARFFEEAGVAVKAVAEAGKYDLIVHKAAFVRPSVDVTPLVLKEMSKRGKSLR